MAAAARPRETSTARRGAAIAAVQAAVDALDLAVNPVDKFAALPLSEATKRGLRGAGFTRLTDIQRSSIPRGLQGRDVLGAAVTGSGKTLAFLVPVLEALWRRRWSKEDGVGAIIISPTRELALQTFQCLAKIGSQHEMSAALIIGGTTLEREQANINTTNILVCTPGRLLQHMDETPFFDCSSLQVLVLDEADRILDLGFSKELNAIIENLPRTRQTMLFSATQTKSVQDLIRLSLSDPDYVSVHHKSASATPEKLTQAYIVAELPSKIDVLYSFLRSHLKSKTIVFLSSCKQVRFVYEALRRLRPGVPLMALHGKQKQGHRVGIFKDFSKKTEAVLFATDIAARGLDFPGVDWVVQLDCPEDADTYIHRVGRTARFNRDGKALLVLLPSEVAMVEQLAARRVPLLKTEVDPSKIVELAPKLQALCAEEAELKYLAQRCFTSYLRSVYLQSDKDVFDVHRLDAEKFAESLGLMVTPKLKFKKRANKAQAETGTAKEDDSDPSAVDTAGEDSDAPAPGSADSTALKPARTSAKLEQLRRRTNQGPLAESRLRIRFNEDEDEEADEFLQSAKTQTHLDMELLQDHEPREATSKKALKKIAKTRAALLRNEAGGGSHLKFDDDDVAVDERQRLVGVSTENQESVTAAIRAGSHDLRNATLSMRESDVIDRMVEKERLRSKNRERKAKLRRLALPAGFEEGVGGVTLAESGSDQEPPSQSSEEESDEDESPIHLHKRAKRVEEAENVAARLLGMQ